MELTKGISPTFKINYLKLIAAGHVEAIALQILEVTWLDFFEMCAKDEEFRKDIDLARESRADRWVDAIALSLQKKYFKDPEQTIERAPSKDENAKDKLDFEKRKFLAQADNPKKYGSAAGSKKADLEINLHTLQLLSPQESLKVLNNDPFNKMVTIDVDYENSTKGEE